MDNIFNSTMSLSEFCSKYACPNGLDIRMSKQKHQYGENAGKPVMFFTNGCGGTVAAGLHDANGKLTIKEDAELCVGFYEANGKERCMVFQRVMPKVVATLKP